MKRISFYLFATLLALGTFFTSCDNDEIVELSQEVAENESSAEQNEDDMFTVQFVNADGTPYEFSGETKANWTGSKASYPYKTPVYAQWSDFKSDATDQVQFSGGEGGSKTISSGSYTIASGIAKDYTISVTKKHKVTVSAGTGGSVTNSGTAYRDNGSSLTLTATPSSGYEFSKFVTNTGWEVTDNPKTFTVSSCFTVTAQFKAKTVTPSTGSMSMSLAFDGNRLKTLRYKLDGTTKTVNSLNVQDGGTVLTVSNLSAGSHSISFVSATVDADGTGDKVLTGSSYGFFSLEGSRGTITSFNVTGGNTTYITLNLNTSK